MAIENRFSLFCDILEARAVENGTEISQERFWFITDIFKGE